MEHISAIDWRQLNSYLDSNKREGNQRTTGSVVDHVPAKAFSHTTAPVHS